MKSSGCVHYDKVASVPVATALPQSFSRLVVTRAPAFLQKAPSGFFSYCLPLKRPHTSRHLDPCLDFALALSRSITSLSSGRIVRWGS